MDQKNIALSIENVSIIFGPKPGDALKLLEDGHDKATIQRMTGQVVGVHACSIELYHGELLVLMGLSGSGKSTLLRAVNGLNPITKGAVHVYGSGGGIDVAQSGRAELQKLRRTHIAMVFQQFGLLPWRTVASNIGLGLELAGMDKKTRQAQIDAQLALVGLADRASARVAELSGGMQQRVGLARAYATSAEILLMDEPFSALDPLIRDHLQTELLAHQKKLNCSIIFVSHDLDEAFKLGDRIAIMEAGRIVQIGTPRQIFHKPSTDYVANFVAQINPMHVLNAGDILPFSRLPKPKPARKTDALTLEETCPAATVITQMNAHNKDAIIVKNNRIIGQINIEAVMACLAHYTKKHGGHPSPQ